MNSRLLSAVGFSGFLSTALFFCLPSAQAQNGNTNIWFGPGAGLNNWSTPGNWTNATVGALTGLVGGDDVKMFNTGGTTYSNVDNVVNTSVSVGSMVYGSTAAATVHTTLINSGVILAITNTAGLYVGTVVDPAVALNLTNTITGAGGSLYVSNTAANISINQANSVGTPSRGSLDLSGLDNFVVNASRIGIGDGQFPGVLNNRAGGNLILAKTNSITLAYTDTLANYQTAGKNAAIILSRNSGNNPGIISLMQLGLINQFNVDSLNAGMDKSGNNSTAAHGVVEFNPLFSGMNPVATFNGAGGPGTRVTWWSVGDGNSSASSSNGGGGTNDFSLGTVNVLVNVMSLARDAASSSDAWPGPHKGVFIFTNGTVDVNTLIIGNQTLETGTSTTPSFGIFNVVGAGALLKINTAMTLGTATLTTAAGTATRGILNITNGTVYANNISVGANSISNAINLVNGTLMVTNALATNVAGLFALNVSNSTLGLTINASGSLKGLAQTFNVSGNTNIIQLLNAGPVIFPSYPQQFPLVKYTTWAGLNNFGLAVIPPWAPGATLVSNGPNKSLDLRLPSDPRPVFTSQPTPYSGSPGDNVNSSFTVSIAATSVTPVGYQWYFATSLTTNLLQNGPGPSGSSTLSGVTSANLQIANAQTADSGNYFVVVTNLYGTNASSQAALIISAGAILPSVSGPLILTATNGVTTAIANAASGSPVPYLFWQFNGTNITDGAGPSGISTLSGSSGSTLTIINPQYPADQGTYSLIASNSAGLATNNTVLTVLVPPTITIQPVSVVVTNTQSASLIVAATGVGNPSYQWNKNGTPISSALNNSATNATFTIASVSAADISTNYSVTVSNGAGATNSVSVSLTVNSVMATTTISPANGTGGICYDTPLYVSFNAVPVLRNAGTIKIFNVSSPSTPVYTANLALNANGVQPRVPGFSGDGQQFNYYPVIITGSTAAIYPPSGVLTSNQTYYVTVDDGAFADTTGAYFAGIPANAWQFTTKAGGPANPTNMFVAQYNSGDFATVQGAVDSVPAANTTPRIINIKNGNYVEIVDISGKGNLTLRGQSRIGTEVGYPNNAGIAAGGGSTHSRMAFKVNANDISLDNLTITNSTPQDASQAEALMIEQGAARLIVNNCNIDSYQDTILAVVSSSKAYFKNSLIQGDVDFIWGGGNLFFTNCEVRWLIRPANSAALGPNPSPTATDINSNGFSFVNCALTSLPGANPNDTVGRTRSITNGNTALINCFVTTNIGGWSSDALPVGQFRNWYFGCTNDFGAPVTLSNGIALSGSDPNVTLAGSAVAWLYGWQPQLAPNIVTPPASQTVSAGQAASFSVSATGIPDPAYQWLDNGVPISGATGSSFAIANAVRTNAGNYSVIVNNGSGSVTSAPAVLTYTGNAMPVGGATFTLGLAINATVTVPIIGGKYPPTDADGDTLTITGVGGATNGTVTTDGVNVTYTATNGTSDSFTYTVADGFGGTGTGTVNIAINNNVQGQNQLAGTTLGNGTNIVTFLGIPGFSYALDLATNLTPPINWMPQATNPAANNGFLIFTNVSTLPQIYYRTRYAP